MTRADPIAYTLRVEGTIFRDITIVSDSFANAERIAKEEFINELKGDDKVAVTLMDVEVNYDI